MATPVPAPVIDTRNGDALAAHAISSLPPELSDRSNANPIVVIIEAVFGQVDKLLFQLGAWPSAVIQKLLALVGVVLNPASASTVQQTFTLTTPQSKDSIIASGTLVATTDGSVIFSTTSDLTIRAYTSPTGTVSTSAGSTAVTGSGTTFLTDVQPGWAISFDGGTTWYVVASVTNNLALVLASSAAATLSGVVYLSGAIAGTTSAQSTTTGLATAVAAGTLTSLQTQPAGVASTTNAAAAAGGADQETLSSVLARAPQALAGATAASASDYAYYASQVLGQNGRSFAQANTNGTVAQTGYMTVAGLSSSWTAANPMTVQDGSNIVRDLAGRTFGGSTTVVLPANIQQFISSPTLPAALIYRQSTTDQASAQVNSAKALNSYLSPNTYQNGRSVYLGDLEATVKSATGVDRVLDILGTKAVGMSWQQAANNMTFTLASATVTGNAGDVANMKPYQTFLVDSTNQAGYLVIAAAGTNITIDRVFGGPTVTVRPFFFHAQTTALTNWYSLPYSALSIDSTAPPASIVVVGVV